MRAVFSNYFFLLIILISATLSCRQSTPEVRYMETIATIDNLPDDPLKIDDDAAYGMYSYFGVDNGVLYNSLVTVETLLEERDSITLVLNTIAGLPVQKGDKILIQHELNEGMPRMSDVISDRFPTETVNKIKNRIAEGISAYHTAPADLISFAFDKHGLDGLRLLYRVSKQTTMVLSDEDRNAWELLQNEYNTRDVG